MRQLASKTILHYEGLDGGSGNSATAISWLSDTMLAPPPPGRAGGSILRDKLYGYVPLRRLWVSGSLVGMGKGFLVPSLE